MRFSFSFLRVSLLCTCVVFFPGVQALAADVTPHVFSRAEWGADESLLFRVPAATSSASSVSSVSVQEDNGAAVSERVKDCEEAQQNFPEEFRVKRRETTDGNGNRYRWPLSYMSSVKMLVVHHTAVKVDGDKRSGAERVQALYQYHAVTLGWGDIGYHYLIDEDGKIYEGKTGGKGVVGGHAYCSNIGTIGIALLGNFEVEQPTQTQLKSLQWLLYDLADTYNIDLTKKVAFHGKTFSPIVRHGDLLATACPGYFVAESMSQIRSHVESGNLFASVKLPAARSVVAVRKRTSPAALTRAARLSRAKAAMPRRVQRVLDSRASRLLLRKLRADTLPASSTSSIVRQSSFVSSKKSASSRASVSPKIRIRLSYSGSKAEVLLPSGKKALLAQDGSTCVLSQDGKVTKRDAIRLEAADGIFTIQSWERAANRFRGTLECRVIDGTLALINELPLETYLHGLAEEPDTEPYEKQRAFAIAARTYAAYYLSSDHRKFPDMPYDGDDSPATFQKYGGVAFEEDNPRWQEAVDSTSNQVLTVGGAVIRAPYFSADDGRTRSPAEIGWNTFPFAEIFASKEDPWCEGETLRGHGVGMSGCGAEGQANEGKTAEQILQYYYPGTVLKRP